MQHFTPWTRTRQYFIYSALLCVFAGWVDVHEAQACAIQTWTQERVADWSTEVWEARVSGPARLTRTHYGTRVEVSVHVTKGPRAGRIFALVYFEGRPHRRPGGKTICPYVSGSGAESKVRGGERVKVWVKDVSEGENPVSLLRMVVVDAGDPKPADAVEKRPNSPKKTGSSGP